MDPWRRVGILDGLSADSAVAQDTLLAHKYRAWALEHPEGSEMPLGNLSMESSLPPTTLPSSFWRAGGAL